MSPDREETEGAGAIEVPAGSTGTGGAAATEPGLAADAVLAAHPADAEVAADLRLLLMRLVRRLRQEASSDLSGPLTSALAAIESGGPLTLGELAARESVKPPGVTRMVTTLAQAGLVVREPDPQDRRVARVRITTAGKRLLQRSRTRKTAYLTRKVHRLSQDDRAALRAAMPVLRKLLEDDQR
jgi:DNA-binding MarR family transcriptional regulator